MDEEERPRCLMSHPAHPHTLSRQSGLNFPGGCFSCNKTLVRWESVDFHYYCATCGVGFHRECYQFPRKIRHSYHLQHPLTLTSRSVEAGIQSHSTPSESSSDPGMYHYDIIPSKLDTVFDQCNCCGKDLGKTFYRCSICNFCLDFPCLKPVPLLTIPNPKSHHHSLSLFPRPIHVACDACGLINKEPIYTCFQCNYMVHLSCTDLPRIIKITRHPHRLSHGPYLPPATLLCRICYKTVDVKYGQYSCDHDDCSYVAHSKCATHKNVWGGKELEWEPEEPDNIEDFLSFKKVGDGLIQHFAHQHYLKLEKYDKVRDMEKQCQACILPIDSQYFYNCKQCDFFLHEICAGLPRKLDHSLHSHTLFLDASLAKNNTRSMRCSTCNRLSSGFTYVQVQR
uniref:Zinc finger PHD-type domain-containing protein n=1 Tax=Noccaea caerulescens TaxID=107243 RepID=A0A1J3IV41_NOCCA